MPRKYSINDKVIKKRKIFNEKSFLKLKNSSALSEKKNSNLQGFIRLPKHINERALKCIHSNYNWEKKRKMAVQFDHMYLNCGDSKTGSHDVTKDLKDFNVLHLDLIQQQAEQIASKDKIIKALRDENETLKARLDRIERRLSLGVQKKTNEVSPISIHTDFSSDDLPMKPEYSPKLFDPKSSNRPHLLLTSASSPRSPNLIDNSDLFSQGKLSKKDNNKKALIKTPQSQSTPPASPPLRVSPRDKKSKKENDENPLQNNNNTININSLDAKHESCNLLSPLTCQKRAGEDSTPTSKKTRNLSPIEHGKLPEESDEGLTDHNLRSRDRTKEYISKNYQNVESFDSQIVPAENSQSNTENESTIQISSLDLKKLRTKPKDDSWSVNSEGILTTNKSYFLDSPRHFSELSPLNEGDCSETQVEIPRWRIKVLTSLYVMEGTENLEDEIFVKRHAKLEQDEKRRKRWDLQRMREQRQYEKLLERYEVRNKQDSNAEHLSFWPNPESAHFLEIDDKLPVCAFGQPLAQIPQSEFAVPWVPDIATRRRRR